MYNTHECDVRIVHDNLSETQAFQYEINLIKYYRDSYPSYRLTNQTIGGEGVSGWDAPQEYRDKMREKNTGINNPNYNNKWTAKQKKTASERVSGLYKDENNPNSKQVMCVETGVIYSTIKEALLPHKIKDHSNMAAALKDKYRTAGGVHWVVGDLINRLATIEDRNKYLIECYVLNSHIHPVLCVETKTVFKSIVELSSSIDVSKDIIRYWLNRKGQYIYNNLTYRYITKVALCSDV